MTKSFEPDSGGSSDPLHEKHGHGRARLPLLSIARQPCDTLHNHPIPVGHI